MRKAISLILVFIIAAVLLSGCESDSQSSDSTGIASKLREDLDNLSSEDFYSHKDTSDSSYTINEIKNAAIATFYSKEGLHPGDISLSVDVDPGSSRYGGDNGYQGEIEIHIYEDHPDHTATLDWYTINCKTWTGTNILGEKIDLRDALNDLP